MFTQGHECDFQAYLVLFHIIDLSTWRTTDETQTTRTESESFDSERSRTAMLQGSHLTIRLPHFFCSTNGNGASQWY